MPDFNPFKDRQVCVLKSGINALFCIFMSLRSARKVCPFRKEYSRGPDRVRPQRGIPIHIQEQNNPRMVEASEGRPVYVKLRD